MNKKHIGVFTLAMINLVAIGSVKNWPTIAESGLSSIFYLILATLIFFLPTALVSAELATGWPKTGGIFIWVKEAFGHRWGFLAIWLLWIENVIWYPTILSYIAATIAYIFNPLWRENKPYIFCLSLIAFWLMTYLNLRGIKMSGKISSLGGILGNVIPSILIIVLGMGWFFSGKPLALTLSWDHFFPDMSQPHQWVIFTGVLLSLCGMEMSAVHAHDVENPQKNYPRAIFISMILIFILSILGVLSIAAVVPQEEISLTAGTMQAFGSFVELYHLKFLIPCMALLMVIGALSGLSTWIIGPSRGLLAAARHGDLPPFFRRINAQGSPYVLLITQGIIVSFLSLLFVFMQSVNSAYWILVVLVTQVYLVMYILMFAAAIKLRYQHPYVFRSYKIPGGLCGIWLVAGMGILSSLVTFIIGLFPPSQIPTSQSVFYWVFILSGVIFICLIPTLLRLFKKPHWHQKLEHEIGEN